MEVSIKNLDEVSKKMDFKSSTIKFREEFVNLLYEGLTFDEIYAMIEYDYKQYQLKSYALNALKTLYETKKEQDYLSYYNEVSNMQTKIVTESDASDMVYALRLANESLSNK